MRIAWLTPFFAKSAVGELAGRAALEIANAGHDVTLVGTGAPPYLPTPLPFVAAGERGIIDPDIVNGFDGVVYNVSNHGSSFPIYWLLERTPGVVILCDRVYTHMIDAYSSAFIGMPGRFESLAQRFYGPEGVDFARRFRANATTPEDMERFPFIEPVLSFAQSAIVHSSEFRDLVQSRWSGDVRELKGFAAPPRSTAPVPPRAAFGIPDDHVVLAYVGYVTPYRALEIPMEILRDRPDLRERITFAVIGRVEDPAYAAALQAKASQEGIASNMRWGFDADDDVKHAVLSHADAAYNCRLVNSEGSSASLLEEMSYGLPVIVNANGFARDVPRDAVCFVERERMRADVETTLERLVNDATFRHDVGEQAARYVDRNSTNSTYANVVAEALESTAWTRPALAAQGRIRAVSEAMGIMDGGDYETQAYAMTASLFGNGRTR